MEFFFSSELHADIGDLYRITRKKINTILNEGLKDKTYGEVLVEIAIIPIILPEDYLMDRKERKLFQRKAKEADYRLIIDYEKFKNGNEKERELLLLNNVISAIKDLTKKAKGKFEGEALISDILELCGYSINEVENI